MTDELADAKRTAIVVAAQELIDLLQATVAADGGDKEPLSMWSLVHGRSSLLTPPVTVDDLDERQKEQLQSGLDAACLSIGEDLSDRISSNRVAAVFVIRFLVSELAAATDRKPAEVLDDVREAMTSQTSD